MECGYFQTNPYLWIFPDHFRSAFKHRAGKERCAMEMAHSSGKDSLDVQSANQLVATAQIPAAYIYIHIYIYTYIYIYVYMYMYMYMNMYMYTHVGYISEWVMNMDILRASNGCDAHPNHLSIGSDRQTELLRCSNNNLPKQMQRSRKHFEKRLAHAGMRLHHRRIVKTNLSQTREFPSISCLYIQS